MNDSIDTSLSSRLDPFKDTMGMMRMMSMSRKGGGLYAHHIIKDRFKDVDTKSIYG